MSITTGETVTASFAYNGSGDWLVEDGVQFVMDLNAGLIQALQDGDNTYLYGNGRIGQFTGVESAYYLGDALGSVRQLADGAGEVTLVQSYEPYGEIVQSMGEGETNYSYTGEWQSSYIKLINLRSRHYSLEMGRFLTRDAWQGDYTTPMSHNSWL